MTTLEDDFNFFSKILNDSTATERTLNSLYSDLQKGFSKCWLPIVQQDAFSIESEDPVSSTLMAEVEEALSKARLIYQNASALNLKPKKSKPCQTLHMDGVSKKIKEGVSISKTSKPLNTTVTENNNTEYTKEKSPIGHKSAKFVPAHVKAPFQTYDQRFKIQRNSSANALLRKSARSLIQNPILSTPIDLFDQQTANIAEKPPRRILPPLVPSCSIFSQSASLLDTERPKQKFFLDPNFERRVEDFLNFDNSLKTCSVAFITESQCLEKKAFSEYIHRLAEKKVDTKFLNQYISCSIPQVVSLFNEFLKIRSCIDWKVATEGQKSWKHQMLSCFSDLFHSIDTFLPTMSPKDEETKTDHSDIPLSEAKAEFLPDIETLLKAYICSGEAVKPNSPEFLSRSELLSVGPAVFSSATVSDLQALLGIWQDICQFQRKLNILSYVERRIPDWLTIIGQLTREKASIFRLLYGFALGSPPVALAKETDE